MTSAADKYVSNQYTVALLYALCTVIEIGVQKYDIKCRYDKLTKNLGG